jgi:hypothetical protein
MISWRTSALRSSKKFGNHFESHGEGGTERPAYDLQRPHAASYTEVVNATDAVRRALDSGAKEISVTVVPLVVGVAEPSETEDIFKFEHAAYGVL